MTCNETTYDYFVGIADSNFTNNPFWANWTFVAIHYCSSDYFTGDHGKQLFLVGFYNFKRLEQGQEQVSSSMASTSFGP